MFEEYRAQIESHGWTLHATTTYADGVSFEARKKGQTLAKSYKQATPELAMFVLLKNVLGRES